MSLKLKLMLLTYLLKRLSSKGFLINQLDYFKNDDCYSYRFSHNNYGMSGVCCLENLISNLKLELNINKLPIGNI